MVLDAALDVTLDAALDVTRCVPNGQKRKINRIWTLECQRNESEIQEIARLKILLSSISAGE